MVGNFTLNGKYFFPEIQLGWTSRGQKKQPMYLYKKVIKRPIERFLKKGYEKPFVTRSINLF